MLCIAIRTDTVPLFLALSAVTLQHHSSSYIVNVLDATAPTGLLCFVNSLVSQQELYCFFPGQYQLIGPPQPIVAILGGDIILPCHLEPAMDVAARTVEWSRPDLEPRFVHVWRNGQDLLIQKNPSYERRTSLSIDKLKHGDISLKLSGVKVSDEGRYRCFIPLLGTESAVELVVDGAASSPVIIVTKSSSGVVLECESKGWYPEPELFWLDAEGKLLSAGAPETVRGPDGLYTVSSRVTVEKSHSNSYTCRVQQSKIQKTKETQIHFYINVILFYKCGKHKEMKKKNPKKHAISQPL
uniref:Ig-like domain-containing protein n=1 Tax=Myripristis murdjan TaxID=586833 RepID=A0A667YV38_9TELE